MMDGRFCLLLVPSLFLAWITTQRLECQEREGIAIEQLYTFLASDLLEPTLCQKIFPEAYQASWWAVPKGYQTYYLRSLCLFNLAVKARHPLFCDKVIERKSWWYDGSKISTKECRRLITTQGTVDIGTIDSELLMLLLGESASPDPWSRYQKMRASPQFRSQLNKLPDFSGRERGSVERSATELCSKTSTPPWLCLSLQCLTIQDPSCRQGCITMSSERRYHSESSFWATKTQRACKDVQHLLDKFSD